MIEERDSDDTTRAERGHVSNSLESKRRKKRQGQDIPRKADVEPQRVIREFKLDGAAAPDVGSKLTVDLLKDVKAVDVIGTTKGRGTQGVMKRHNFAGLPAAHVAAMPGPPAKSNNGSSLEFCSKAGKTTTLRLIIRPERVCRFS